MRTGRILAGAFALIGSLAIIGLEAGVTGASFTASTTNPTNSLITLNVQPPATQNAATSAAAGTVNLSWTATPTAPNGHTITYLVLRNGVQIGTTAGLVYSDTPPADGTYSYTVQTKIAQGAGFFSSGNSAAQSGLSDRTAPTMSATCNGGACTGWFNGSVTFVVSGADGAGAGMGTATTNVDAAGAITSAAPRTITVSGQNAAHSIVYSGADALGNASGNTTQTVKIDLTNPNPPTGVTGASGSWGGGASFNVSWSAGSDALSGVAGYTVHWTNAVSSCPTRNTTNYPNAASVGAVTAYAVTTAVSSGNDYCAYVTTTDNAGNQSAASNGSGLTQAR
ncbi:MAG: hypothetical protein QOH08_1954 [Chloroflexota bacterium]|jgi:hypothetical protein|nr:hypothetical protein [Chloroflexota bacterium]